MAFDYTFGVTRDDQRLKTLWAAQQTALQQAKAPAGASQAIPQTAQYAHYAAPEAKAQQATAYPQSWSQAAQQATVSYLPQQPSQAQPYQSVGASQQQAPQPISSAAKAMSDEEISAYRARLAAKNEKDRLLEEEYERSTGRSASMEPTYYQEFRKQRLLSTPGSDDWIEHYTTPVRGPVNTSRTLVDYWKNPENYAGAARTNVGQTMYDVDLFTINQKFWNSGYNNASMFQPVEIRDTDDEEMQARKQLYNSTAAHVFHGRTGREYLKNGGVGDFSKYDNEASRQKIPYRTDNGGTVMVPYRDPREFLRDYGRGTAIAGNAVRQAGDA